MILSIVTVVRNDLPGLLATMDSVRTRLQGDYEHWIIDGSTDSAIRDHLARSAGTSCVKWISEPDRGLYDAMNKGLERAAGDFVVFVNAGDVLSPMLDVGLLFDRLRRETRVLIGHTVESWADRKWLRPGLGRERDVYVAPPHQATFYPRAFYESARYRLDIRVAGDCEYTARAIASCGAAYLPTVVCEFALGGLSSSYGSVKTIRLRLRESHTVKSRLKLFSKIAMWHVLPRSLFYGVLALGKYTPLATGRSIHLRTAGIEPVPPSALRSQGG